jgi:hypothetical protein
MCPYYLDGDLVGKSLAAPPGDTRLIGYCVVFKVREEASVSADGSRDRSPPERRRTAGLSKLNSMRSASLSGGARGCAPWPDPVDMSSGRSCAQETPTGAREL